ncbi:MAG: hypothetical protein R2758_05630 [Bacteroidales bacterium]
MKRKEDYDVRKEKTITPPTPAIIPSATRSYGEPGGIILPAKGAETVDSCLNPFHRVAAGNKYG